MGVFSIADDSTKALVRIMIQMLKLIIIVVDGWCNLGSQLDVWYQLDD